MSNSKGNAVLALIAFVFVALLLVSLLYFFGRGLFSGQSAKNTPTTGSVARELPIASRAPNLATDSTNPDLKKHTGKTFTLDYPKSFRVKKLDLIPTSEYPKLIERVSFTDPDTEAEMIVTVGRNYLNLNLDNALGKGPNLSYTADVLQNKTLERIKIDGKEAVAVDGIKGAVDEYRDILVLHRNLVYQINLVKKSESEPLYQPIIESIKILETLEGYDKVEWIDATNLIRGCRVSKVTEFRDKNVLIELKNGSLVKTTEPQIDVIWNFVNEANRQCDSDIAVATE